MKTVKLQNNMVVEIIPLYALPVEKWYGVEFAKQCIEAPDNVEQGMIYNMETNSFINPNIKTLEQLKENALQRISGKCSAAIENGVIVDGKRYLLRKYDDQNALTSALEKARNGAETIPYKAVGDILPQSYTATQIEKIAKIAEEWGQANLSYRALLLIWIERETDVDILNGVEYGSPLPDDLMQELVKSLAGFGIDITKYASMLIKQEVQNENK